jgi:alpha-beta hydrolase superfamily lysophospholipase
METNDRWEESASKTRNAVSARPVGRVRRHLTRAGRRVLRIALWIATIIMTIVLVRAFDARGKPDLRAWHRPMESPEFLDAPLPDNRTLADYMAIENALFDELKSRVEPRTPPEDRLSWNRYYAESRMNPENYDSARNWNRTFELEPTEAKGGVLLLHGMTDAPYSMRHIAEIYRQRGFYALAMRLPAHGTVPGALIDITWEDWMAAVRLGARHVRSKIGPDAPFHIVGYSNGGALAVKYALETAGVPDGTAPDRLVLISPMIGVSRFAGLANVLGALAVIPYFEKSRWLDNLPEYIPYKYNSFPTNAGRQSHRLTRAIQADLLRAGENGTLQALPPMLTFQSAVDATVSTPAVIENLYAHLSDPRSELVVFDTNEFASTRALIKASDHDMLIRLLGSTDLKWRLSAVANANADTADVVERTYLPGTPGSTERPLGLSWPAEVYSLSHLAISMPVDDPLYGLGHGIGGLNPRGEKGTLYISADQFARLYCNPFFPYVQEKIGAWIDAGFQP